MAQKFYKIVDKNGVELPEHWSGRRRTYEEAKKMVDNLNKNGEVRPYTMIEIGGNITQQTAVEWLVEQLKKQGFLYDLDIEQAKQMEKEQIVNAWRNGDNDSMYSDKELDEQAEQYYNETYGGQGSPDTTTSPTK